MTTIACLLLLAADPALTARVTADKPPAFADLLDAKAIRVESGDDTTMTLWLRKAIPTTASAEQIRNGLTYHEVAPGTLVGVVRFAAAFTDFRKQEIPAGDYTLRLGFQPAIGDHVGTAPHPEFLMLSPLADDTTADELEAKALLKLSSKTTGGDHPAVMLLYPQSAKVAAPKIESKPGRVSVLVFARKVESSEGDTTLSFALAVRGWSKTR